MTDPTQATRTDPSTPGPAGGAGLSRSDGAALTADLVVVLVFAGIGRRSHGEADPVTGVLLTAWPFGVGAMAGWVLVLLLRRSGRAYPGRGFATGAWVLAATVVVGMALRRSVAGGGTPVSFLVVATTFLALFLLGWRLAVRLRRGPA